MPEPGAKSARALQQTVAAAAPDLASSSDARKILLITSWCSAEEKSKEVQMAQDRSSFGGGKESVQQGDKEEERDEYTLVTDQSLQTAERGYYSSSVMGNSGKSPQGRLCFKVARGIVCCPKG
ncbi:hypothetical protein MLD38_017313 [Melastoma candidum]|uniref:Uncharacterized protein n=1 Tax=Melastoma candidum TaxID=119954 RepID=A0ACB9QQ84_9MYRT|nr:hypothetical protein MLD38_017313 [Melastoma candidum]